MHTEDRIGQALRKEWQSLTEAERQLLQAILHRHARTARNVNELETQQLTAGQRVADAVARNMGSWRFIIVQSCLLSLWIVLNITAWIQRWDPYPFILLNLVLSFQAAYAAPIIMMSQNRQAAKDRLTAELDYQVNLRAELEVAAIQARLDELSGQQWQALLKLQRRQLELLGRIEQLTREVHLQTTNEMGPPPAGAR